MIRNNKVVFYDTNRVVISAKAVNIILAMYCIFKCKKRIGFVKM